MTDDGVRGRFLWHELLTRDPDAAVGFYTSVVRWDTEEFEGGEEPYTMWTRGETPVGGLMRLPDEAVEEGAPSHWLPYVGTPDVDGTVGRAEGLGAGVYVAPRDIPSVGRFAVLGDPDGAIFAVYAPENPPAGLDAGSEPGDFSWHELVTSDHRDAFDFYSELFGWEKTDEMDMGEAGIYLMYGQGDRTYGGMYDRPEAVSAPPHWLCYAMVDDADAAAERVKEGGGQILNGPMDVPGGDRIVQCLDPQGAAFALHSKASAEGG